MKTYRVTYFAEYEVEATNPDEAIGMAIDQHENLPDGIWHVALEDGE